MKTRTLVPVLLVGSVVLLTAADWPQWRGPDRSDISHETHLLKHWPAQGPRLLWTFNGAGNGYAGPAIVGDRLYLMGANDSGEFLLAIDVKTGEKVWSGDVGSFYKNNYGSGPRSTPTVDGDLIVVLGANGDLVGFDRVSGGKKWWVKLTDKNGIGGRIPGWGYSESPLIDGPRVVCSPGGPKGTIAAFDKNNGEVLWRTKALTDDAAYSSIVIAEIAGKRQYIQQTMKGIVGLAPEDGSVLWSYPRGEYRTAVIPTVVVRDGLIYCVSGYGAGAALLKVEHSNGKFEVKNLYESDARKVMDNKHGGVVAVGDAVFGWSDSKRGQWVCQDLKDGHEVWSSTKLGRGSLTCADGNLYCYSEKDGTCVLVPATRDGWQEKGRVTVPRHPEKREFNNNVWTHPVVANGKLYLRDQEFLFCYDVKENLN
jgi:outer membrane protein assembly factor BamB